MEEKNLYSYRNNFVLYDSVQSDLRIGQRIKVKPQISVLVPSYNHSEYLERAIRSVLEQKTDIVYEIIVVDNNHPQHQPFNELVINTINSEKVCYYVNSKNLGACGNWNRCLELAKGDYITFCHDDDMLLPDALSVLYNSIDPKAPKRYIIGSNIDIDANDIIIRRKNGFFDSFNYNYSKYLFLINNPNNGCGSLYHRTSLIGLGGYDSDYYPTFDYAMNVKYSSRYGAIKISKKTFKYRITESSESASCYKDIPTTVEAISSSVLASIHLFKRIAQLASRISIKMGKQMSEAVWEGKQPSISLFDRMYLFLYVKIVTLLNIRPFEK